MAVEPVRSFVPQHLNPADVPQLQSLYNELIDRELPDRAAAERWLADFSELTSAVDEYGARRYIDKSRNTEDREIERRFMQFVEEVEPQIKPLYFRLQAKFLAAPAAEQLQGQRFDMLRRKWRADVELFREANVPIETEVTKLVTAYDKVSGSMMVNFRGQDYTMQQIARFIEQPDRATRQEAWELSARRRLADREAIEVTFEKLLPLRQQIALNAGLPDYRAYAWKNYKRFDYTPEQCLAFGDAIERAVLPVVETLDHHRAADLKLDRLRPWDLSVDPRGRAPLKPFADGDVDQFTDLTQSIFRDLSPELADEFQSLRDHHNLDLQSRRGKQPGGYQYSLEESKQPFIFMNAAGMQRDVETLLHEGGHAFHFIAAARVEPLTFLRSAPMEFCEVASMAMELLGSEHFGRFYADPADAARAKRTMIEGIIRFLPWMAIVDGFQHWLYAHPGHTRAARTAAWLALLDRFGSRRVDWSGFEDVREAQWQRQLHLFHAPFYYIEYGIAQLGALQLWVKSQEDPRKALANYRAALALGGTRPLPELFSAAGIRFDFSEKTLRPLMDAMAEELERLPR